MQAVAQQLQHDQALVNRSKNPAAHINVQVLVQAVAQHQLVRHGHALRLHGVVGTVVVPSVVILRKARRRRCLERGR